MVFHCSPYHRVLYWLDVHHISKLHLLLHLTVGCSWAFLLELWSRKALLSFLHSIKYAPLPLSSKMVSSLLAPLFYTVRLLLHPATHPSRAYSMAVRAIPLSVCRHGPPNGYRSGYETCSDAQQIYSANSRRWHKCKSGWSLKTEKIHLKWHVYIDTTHTIWHLFLTWTSSYPFSFPQTLIQHIR
jgi:hypothetical protein